MKRRYELCDEQWAIVAPLLPNEDKGFGRPRRDDRPLMNGMFCLQMQ
jgi:transposase